MTKIWKSIMAVFAFAALMVSSTAAMAQDSYQRWFRINNYSDVAITHVYVSNVGRNQWGPDQLGEHIVFPGESMLIDAEDYTGYCRYDLKAVTEEGEVLYLWRANLCVVTDWNIR